MREKRRAYQPILDSLQQRWPADVLLWMDGNEAVLYQTYPYVLRSAFPAVGDRDVQTLAMACRMFFESVILADGIVDDHCEEDPGHLYLRTVAMQYEAYRLFQALFPPDVGFWDRFRTILVAYATACARERRFRTGAERRAGLTRDVALEIALGKYPFGRIAAYGMAELARDAGPLDALARSIEQFDLASYYWDDLTDWRKDIADRTPSLTIGYVLDAYPQLRGEDLAANADEFARALYYGRVAELLLQTGIEHLDRARALVADLAVDDWRAWLASFRADFVAQHREIKQIVERNLCGPAVRAQRELTVP